jgi:hypothetical protein
MIPAIFRQFVAWLDQGFFRRMDMVQTAQTAPYPGCEPDQDQMQEIATSAICNSQVSRMGERGCVSAPSSPGANATGLAEVRSRYSWFSPHLLCFRQFRIANSKGKGVKTGNLVEVCRRAVRRGSRMAEQFPNPLQFRGCGRVAKTLTGKAKHLDA